jgi:DNA polymerase-4
MAQGADPEPLQLSVPAPRSMGHGKVMPPNTRERAVVLTYLLHMSVKVAARLRRHTMVAQTFAIGLRSRDGWIGTKLRTTLPTQDARDIMRLAREMLEDCWQGQGVHQVQVTAIDPRAQSGQLELFGPEPDQNIRPNTRQQTDKLAAAHATTNATMDRINTRYGEFALAPARLLQRSTMPNVIAPAWKPYGHRQTIQDEEADARTTPARSASE